MHAPDVGYLDFLGDDSLEHQVMYWADGLLGSSIKHCFRELSAGRDFLETSEASR